MHLLHVRWHVSVHHLCYHISPSSANLNFIILVTSSAFGVWIRSLARVRILKCYFSQGITDCKEVITSLCTDFILDSVCDISENHDNMCWEVSLMFFFFFSRTCEILWYMTTCCLFAPHVLSHNTVDNLFSWGHSMSLTHLMYVELKEHVVRTMYSSKDCTALTTSVSATETYSCMFAVSVKK